VVMLLRICCGCRFLPVLFSGILCVSILVLVLRYSSQDAGVVVVLLIADVVIIVLVIAVVDITDADKRLRHGLRLHPAHHHPYSPSVCC